MRARFDSLAEDYADFVPDVPREFVLFVAKRLGLNPTDRVVELGAGSGNLAIPLSQIVGHVAAVDVSAKMLAIGSRSCGGKRVEWIQGDAAGFSYPLQSVDAVLSYGAFHLFNSPARVLSHVSMILRPGGAFCLGWSRYEWESRLKLPILAVFKEFGIDWGPWEYSTCRGFARTVRQARANLSPPVYAILRVPSETSIERIAGFLANIDKTAGLDLDERDSLRRDLLKAFKRAGFNGVIRGESDYGLKTVRRIR